MSRRSLLGAASASLFVPAVARAGSMPTTAQLGRAKAALQRHARSLKDTNRFAIADFAEASRTPRFHLVDLANGRMRSLLVSHGKGSDPTHVGWLQRFSNEEGSEATSQGAYRTDDLYHGKHGLSMRLDGLDPSNSKARDRAIVVHAASYVSRDMAKRMGKVGRSQGCFAFEECDLRPVLEFLGDGRMIWAERA